MDKYLKEIMADLTENLNSSLWRNRESRYPPYQHECVIFLRSLMFLAPCNLVYHVFDMLNKARKCMALGTPVRYQCALT